MLFIYVYMRNSLISQTIPCCKERPKIVIFNIYGRVMLPMLLKTLLLHRVAQLSRKMHSTSSQI